MGAELSDEESGGEGRNLMKGNQKVLPRVYHAIILTASKFNTRLVSIQASSQQ